MVMRSYQDLKVWPNAMGLAGQVYRVTAAFPQEEIYGLTRQMRRAATSIPANIAEGWARRGRKEFLQSLHIPSGSLQELETYLLLAQRVTLRPPEQAQPLLRVITTVSRQLISLRRSLLKS